MHLQQILKQTDLPCLATCAAYRHVASQAGLAPLVSVMRAEMLKQAVIHNDSCRKYNLLVL